MSDPKTIEKSENPINPAPLASVAKRYEVVLPHVAAEIAAYPAIPGEGPIALYKHALMGAMVQIEAAGKSKMLGADTVVARQRDLVQMLAEVTAAPKPAKK